MCDTFVIMPNKTKNKSVIFGKNSDREPNEAQVLEHHSANEYKAEAALQCTYIEVPQVKQTNAVLISRPFWMWGAEIGANEHGVVIGNEAVFSKIPAEKKEKLLGMDMLRIALERANTAQNAMDTIIQHIADYGQGGPCGFEDKKLVYHNSFIIADPKEAWVLETVAHMWVAKKVTDYYAISNGYTIGEEYDLSHPDVISYAQNKGWHKKGTTFNFSKSYSDWFYTTFSRCNVRRESSLDNLGSKNDFDVKDAFAALRDHGTDDYSPDSHFLMNHVCAHSANGIARDAAQSTASLVAELGNENTFWATGTSAPCTSIFKPIRFNDNVLPNIGAEPSRVFTEKSLWWEHEKLHRTILIDYSNRHPIAQIKINNLEDELIEKQSSTSNDNFFELTSSAFERANKLEQSLLEDLQVRPIKKPNKRIYRKYWEKQNSKADLNV